MEYFKRPHAFRRWRLVLSMMVPAIALLWMAGMARAGSRAPYSSGPVSASHTSFGERCELCHVSTPRAFRSHVTDTACLACHDAPAHKANQTFTPTCASCHLDHRGRIRLAAVDDGFCEQCHQAVQTTDNRHTVATTVGRFSRGHPEFAARRTGSLDNTVLHFNHAVHLKPDLHGPNGPTRLDCGACHSMTDPIGRLGVSAGRRGGVMAPVTYAQQCASCHPLAYDPLIDQPAPHDQPEMVRAAVVNALRAYITAHPEQVSQPDPIRGRIPVNFPVSLPRAARNTDEWVTMRLPIAERFLWTKTCAECHTLEDSAPAATAAAGTVAPGVSPAAPPLPRVVPTNVPAVWMPHAHFDHRAHRLATCASCHAADASRDTSDVLMPSIATCRQCHKPDNGAESRCFECHQYHDWAHAKPITGGFELRQLTN